MNERIRELYRQAHTDGFFGMAFDPEKFAELIVQKCLYIVESEDDCGPDTKSVRFAMLKIKQYFGVES